MDAPTIVAVVSIAVAGLTIAVGVLGPAFAQGRALMKALEAMAQQPDEANAISRNLFVGLAMIESLAIYCLVVAVIIIFANPFWAWALRLGGK